MRASASDDEARRARLLQSMHPFRPKETLRAEGRAKILVSLFQIRRQLGGAICAHARVGELGSPPELISQFLGRVDMGRPLSARSAHQAVPPLIG